VFCLAVVWSNHTGGAVRRSETTFGSTRRVSFSRCEACSVIGSAVRRFGGSGGAGSG
jgi:hypothetical protein